MALPFSAAHLAELRRIILSSLTNAELLRLNAALGAAVRGADAKAQAAQDAAAAATTPEYVQSALSEYASREELAAAVSGLASEDYVDGKFDGAFTGSLSIDGTVYAVENGLIMDPGGP